MKQNYQQPQMELVTVEIADLLTLSGGGSTDGLSLNWDDKEKLE